MYGVSADLDLRAFVGAYLAQIAIGQYQLQFHFTNPEDRFGPGPNLSIEGYWELRAADGALLDDGPNKSRLGTEPIARSVFCAHALLGQTVANFRVAAPESFTLVFDNGQQLLVFDNSDRYESFSIQPGDIFI